MLLRISRFQLHVKKKLSAFCGAKQSMKFQHQASVGKGTRRITYAAASKLKRH